MVEKSLEILERVKDSGDLIDEMKKNGIKSLIINKKDVRDKVDHLFKLYSEDRYYARIFYMNSSIYEFTSDYISFHINGKNDLTLEYYKKSYHISLKNNRLYSRITNKTQIIYKNGVFYQRTNKKIRYLKLNNFKNIFVINTSNNYYEGLIHKLVLGEIIKREGWLRNILEITDYIGNRTLYWFKRNKIFNEVDYLKFVYKLPYKISKFINSHRHTGLGIFLVDNLDMFEDIQNIININNLLKNEYFEDLCRISNILGLKVKLSWSYNRIKEEHNKRSKMLTEIMSKISPYRELICDKVFIDFQKFSGYEMITNNHRLYAEGVIQKHCVASYESSINSGNRAIFHIDGYTLELVKVISYIGSISDDEVYLSINQLRGFNNKKAPDDLYDKINKKVKSFNETLKKADFESNKKKHN